MLPAWDSVLRVDRSLSVPSSSAGSGACHRTSLWRSMHFSPGETWRHLCWFLIDRSATSFLWKPRKSNVPYEQRGRLVFFVGEESRVRLRGSVLEDFAILSEASRRELPLVRRGNTPETRPDSKMRFGYGFVRSEWCNIIQDGEDFLMLVFFAFVSENYFETTGETVTRLRGTELQWFTYFHSNQWRSVQIYRYIFI